MLWTFNYSPFTSQSGKEIPAYEILDSKYRTILTTNENHSDKQQYKVACLASKAPEFSELSKKIVCLWCEGANFHSAGFYLLNTAIYDLAALLERA